MRSEILKILRLTFFLFMLFSCARTPADPALPKVEVIRKPSIKEYFWKLAETEPVLQKMGKRDISTMFTIDKPENGILALSIEESGADIELVLFRGIERDLVMMETKRCGTGCSYSYGAFEFTPLAHQSIALESVMPIQEIREKARRSIPATKKNGMLEREWPGAEHMRFILPQANKPVEVYLNRPVKYFNYSEEGYFSVGSLAWQKEIFRFTFSPKEKAPVSRSPIL